MRPTTRVTSRAWRCRCRGGVAASRCGNAMPEPKSEVLIIDDTPLYAY